MWQCFYLKDIVVECVVPFHASLSSALVSVILMSFMFCSAPLQSVLKKLTSSFHLQGLLFLYDCCSSSGPLIPLAHLKVCVSAGSIKGAVKAALQQLGEWMAEVSVEIENSRCRMREKTETLFQNSRHRLHQPPFCLTWNIFGVQDEKRKDLRV